MSLARISHRNAPLAEDPTGSIVKTAPLALDVPQTDAAAEFFAVASVVDDAGMPLNLQAFASCASSTRRSMRATWLRDR